MAVMSVWSIIRIHAIDVVILFYQAFKPCLLLLLLLLLLLVITYRIIDQTPHRKGQKSMYAAEFN